MDKKQRAAQRQQEDTALNRGLIWVGIALLMELLLIVVKRSYLEYGFEAADVDLAIMMDSLLKGIRMAAPVLAIACLVWAFLQLKRKKKAGIPVSGAVLLSVITLCVHVVVKFKDSGASMLFLMIPALAGLALIYFLYQKEFFLAAVAAGLSAVGLWFVRAGVGLGRETLVMAAGILVVLAVTFWFKQNKGVVKLLGESYAAVPENTNYTIPLLAGAISLLALVAAMFMGGAVAYYLLFAMVALLFVLLVYYTVKMM